MSSEKRGRPRKIRSESPEKTENNATDSVDVVQTVNPWEEDMFQSQPTEKTIQEVKENFDVSKLTERHKNYIGLMAGLKIWDVLSSEEKKRAWGCGTFNTYYSHSVFNPGNIPPLLTYKKVGKGFKNEYIINLNSMRPTKSSPIQEPVPESVIKHFLEAV